MKEGLFKKHIRWLRKLTVFKFITLMATYCIMFGMLFSLISSSISDTHQSAFDDLKQIQMWKSFLIVIIVFPIIETFIGQWFTIFIIEIFLKNEMVVIIGSSLFFALGHFGSGLDSIIVGFYYGIILSFSFLTWRAFSKWRAFWVTMTIHLIINSFYFLLDTIGRL